VSLPPLATLDDISGRLGRPLTDAEATRAPLLLTDASAQVRRYCRRDFLLHASETDIFRCHDSEIQLPDKTTTEVISVTAIGSDFGGGIDLPDIPVPWFVYDGIDRIRLDLGTDWIINLPYVWLDSDYYPQTYSVVRSYGYVETPDEVTAVCATAVIGVLTAPTMAAGLIGETVGPFSYRMERSGGGTAVALTQADLASLKDFRMTTATLMTRLR
jgi:hypothetical protein